MEPETQNSNQENFNNEPENSFPKEEITEQPLQNKKEGVVGPIVGSVIIILIILLGGLYYVNYIKSQTNTDGEVTQQEVEAEMDEMENELTIDDAYSIMDELEEMEAEMEVILE